MYIVNEVGPEFLCNSMTNCLIQRSHFKFLIMLLQSKHINKFITLNSFLQCGLLNLSP